jgi:hypothetical protein
MLPAATNFLDPTVQPEWGPSPPTEASYSAGFRNFKALIEFLLRVLWAGYCKKELESRDQ